MATINCVAGCESSIGGEDVRGKQLNVSKWVDEGDNTAFEINESLFELVNAVSEVYNGAFEISEVASQVQNADEYVNMTALNVLKISMRV